MWEYSRTRLVVVMGIYVACSQASATATNFSPFVVFIRNTFLKSVGRQKLYRTSPAYIEYERSKAVQLISKANETCELCSKVNFGANSCVKHVTSHIH